MGGVSYGSDTSRAEYEMSIYHIAPTISSLSILSYVSCILQDRELSRTIYQPGGLPYGIDTIRSE